MYIVRYRFFLDKGAMSFGREELKTVQFNLEPKRCKSVSLSAKCSVFTLVGLTHGVVTEKLRFP